MKRKRLKDAMSWNKRQSPFHFEDGLLLFGLIVIALPMLVFPLGLGRDYPNHLARIYIESMLFNSPHLQNLYRLDWGNIPDLAMDIFLPFIAPYVGIFTAASLFNAIAVILLPLGAWLLSRYIYNSATPYTTFALLSPFGANLAWGFMNYVFAAGVALLLFVLWLRNVNTVLKAVLFSIFTIALYFFHVLGFLVLGLMVLAWEAGALFSMRGGPGLVRAGFRRAVMLSVAFLPPLIFFGLLFIGDQGLDTRLADTWGGLSARVESFVSVFDFYNPWIAIILCALVFATFAKHLRTMPRTGTAAGIVGGLEFERDRAVQHSVNPVVLSGMFSVLFALGSLTLLAPVMYQGIWGLHLRYGALFFVILCVIIPWRGEGSESNRRFVLTVFLFCFAFQQWNVWAKLSDMQNRQEQLASALTTLPQGGRLISARSDELFGSPLVDIMHSQSLAVILRDAFVVNLFTNTSPVRVADALLPLHQPQAWPLTEALLKEGVSESLGPAAVRPTETRYWSDWPRHFDFLLWFDVKNSARSPNFPFLREVASGRGFRLFRINSGGETP